MQLSVIHEKIYTFRGVRLMIDRDLAEMYGVETRVLNQAVRRNIKRFPPDFMFRLNREEADSLKSQFVILKNEGGRGRHTKYLPYAFTEQGVAMLSSILKSKRAIQVNIFIVRSFVMLRQVALHYRELEEKIKRLEEKYEGNFNKVFEALQYLMVQKEQEADFKNRPRIGFRKE
jgi:ORF6N domain